MLSETEAAAWDFLFDPNGKTFGPPVQSDGTTAYESFWGMLPERLLQANPVVTQIGSNVSNYVDGIGDAASCRSALWPTEFGRCPERW
ncbi:MAG: hypothetical protein KDB47_09735 [Mycobacterium sp.]|nr:hypothetical protein [Mycobacterium sp.]